MTAEKDPRIETELRTIVKNETLHRSYVSNGYHPCSCILEEDHHQEELDDIKREDSDW